MTLSPHQIHYYARQLTHTGALYANASPIFTIEFTHTNTIILSNEACHFIIPTLYLADIHAIMQACCQGKPYTLIHQIHHPYFHESIHLYSYHDDPNTITCMNRSPNIIGQRVLRPQPHIYIDHRNIPISTIIHDISARMHADFASVPNIPTIQYTQKNITDTHPAIPHYPDIHTTFCAKGISYSPYASIEIGITICSMQANSCVFIPPSNNPTLLHEKYQRCIDQLITEIHEQPDIYTIIIGHSQHARTAFSRSIQQSLTNEAIVERLQRCVHDIYHHYHYTAP